MWGSGDEERKLEAAIGGSLQVAESLELSSLAFPAISTGIFGFPKELAASIFYRVIIGYFREHPKSGIRQVRLTLYDRTSLEVFVSVWESQGLDQALPLDH